MNRRVRDNAPYLMNSPEILRLDRRTAIKWMMTASAAVAFLRSRGLGDEPMVHTAPVFAHGYGTDPDLVKRYEAGDVWPLTFTAAQRQTVATLCDVILPADEHSPAASALGVPDFIDEWISAPYPEQQADRPVMLEGLAWIEVESQRRFGLAFGNTIPRQQRAICDDICHAPDAKPEFQMAAEFFRRFRDLASGGYFTTTEGMKALGYIGNVPLAKFEGAPAELIKRLGLEDA